MKKIPLTRVILGLAVTYIIFVIPLVYIGQEYLLWAPHGDIEGAVDPKQAAFNKVFYGVTMSGLIVVVLAVLMFAIYEKKGWRKKSQYLIGGLCAGCITGPAGIITVPLGMLMTYIFWKIAVQKYQ